MSTSDLPEDLDPRIAGALDELSSEFQQRLADTRDEIVRMVAASASAVAQAAEAPPTDSGDDSLEEVKQAITRIDQGTTQAEILTAINRVNMIYERDLGIRLLLVANDGQLIEADTDNCFSNNDSLSFCHISPLSTLAGYLKSAIWVKICQPSLSRLVMFDP